MHLQLLNGQIRVKFLLRSMKFSDARLCTVVGMTHDDDERRDRPIDFEFSAACLFSHDPVVKRTSSKFDDGKHACDLMQNHDHNSF